MWRPRLIGAVSASLHQGLKRHLFCFMQNAHENEPSLTRWTSRPESLAAVSPRPHSGPVGAAPGGRHTPWLRPATSQGRCCPRCPQSFRPVLPSSSSVCVPKRQPQEARAGEARWGGGARLTRTEAEAVWGQFWGHRCRLRWL